MRDVAVFLYDRTGVMAQPWAEAGYTCYCVDIQHKIRRERVEGNIHFVWGDVRTWAPPLAVRRRLAFGFAFPVCTHVCVSGARDFLTKGTALLRDSLEMFSAAEHAFKWAGVPYGIENSVGKFSDHMGKPDYTFQPWHYGDPWTKLTCVWAGNGFVMPPREFQEMPEGTEQKIWLMPPSDERADLRSATPPGFARAVFQSNHAALLRAAA